MAAETPVDGVRSIRGRRKGFGTWPVRDLPNWLVAFIAMVVLGDATALYLAKEGGRDQVQMISASRELSASAS